jgi:hypothetical protein
MIITIKGASMSLLKASTGLIMGLSLLQSIYAANSTFEIGSMDRNQGGRVYTIGLDSANLEQITLSSISDKQSGKLKVTKVLYTNGSETVSLLQRNKFISQAIGSLSYQVEYLNSYPYTDERLNCEGPCIVVQAEAYGANDVHLTLDLSSTNDEKIAVNSISGFSAYSKSKDPKSDESDVENRIDLGNSVIEFEHLGMNIDGSYSYNNFRVLQGQFTFHIDADTNHHEICRAIGRTLSIPFTSASLERKTFQPSYERRTAVVLMDSGKLRYADGVFRSIDRLTCN